MKKIIKNILFPWRWINYLFTGYWTDKKYAIALYKALKDEEKTTTTRV